MSEPGFERLEGLKDWGLVDVIRVGAQACHSRVHGNDGVATHVILNEAEPTHVILNEAERSEESNPNTGDSSLRSE